MTATCHTTRIGGWVADAISTACMGQDFGYDVRFDAGRPIGVNGGPLMIAYTVIITLRHPLLGQPPFAGNFTVAVEKLEDEAGIRAITQHAVMELGKLHKATIDGIKNGPAVKAQPPPPGIIRGN